MEPATEVRAIVDEVIAAGLRPEALHGAGDAEIDDQLRRQGVAAIPPVVREIYRLVGKVPTYWFRGSAFGVAMDGTREKAAVRSRTTRLTDGSVRDPAGLFVMVAHQGYAYTFLDGADLAEPDPPVWIWVEGEAPYRGTSVTAWFRAAAPDMAQQRNRIGTLLEITGPHGVAMELAKDLRDFDAEPHLEVHRRKRSPKR